MMCKLYLSKAVTKQKEKEKPKAQSTHGPTQAEKPLLMPLCVFQIPAYTPFLIHSLSLSCIP